ncbi:RIO1 family-domain-containing protein, partial [Baffinella frigidus]
TINQVLDPRTRLVLYKLLNKETLNSIHGCISTGKEANVYYATTPPSFLDENDLAGSRTSDGKEGELAIKVYKTSILVFKDRDKYVSGDYRFRQGYSRHNPRKMVKMWAEKEYRNLLRMRAAGKPSTLHPKPETLHPKPETRIPCPKPLLLKLHLLLMEFIGKNGKAAPRLKDAGLTGDKICQAYVDCCMCMRAMYQKCRLVHGDLSEYNMLHYRGTLYIIDVSQSVDLDHPNALEFLRRDAANVNDFFCKVFKPETRTPEPGTRNPTPAARNPKSETWNPKPETTANPETRYHSQSLKPKR